MQPEEMGYNPFLFSRLHAVDLEFIDWRRDSNLSVLTICASGDIQWGYYGIGGQ
jgi:ABC-type taurine transport system substrate-binding protein